MTVVRPETLDEVLAALSDAPNADLLAGGTDFMVEGNLGHPRPRAVVAPAAHESAALALATPREACENQEAIVATNEGRVLYVELPASVALLVTYTETGMQGDRSTGGTKPATLETGAEIQVPLFLTTGEKVKVDTRDGRYLGRIS